MQKHLRGKPNCNEHSAIIEEYGRPFLVTQE